MSAPPLFTTEPFERAAATAQTQGRLLLVDFTAEWRGPCKNMDRTTWRDPSVVEWVSRHAIAVQVDVDAQEAIAKRFDVRAMPTLLLLRDALDPKDPGTWMHLASHLIDAGRLDEAWPHVEKLWLHSLEVEPAFVGVRLSFLINLIAQLTRGLPAAKARFVALRDELTPRLATDAAAGADWFARNDALEDDARSLAWLDEVKAQPPDWVGREHRVQSMLITAERWDALGRLLRDPVGLLTSLFDRGSDFSGAGVPAEQAAEMREWFSRHFREQAGVFMKALRAADRQAEAAEVQRVARARDPSDEMRAATE